MPNQVAETLIRTLSDHIVCCSAGCRCARCSTVPRRWPPTFAYAASELGFTADVCYPRRAKQKGSVEILVGWVTGSFFEQRRPWYAGGVSAFPARDEVKKGVEEGIYVCHHLVEMERVNLEQTYLVRVSETKPRRAGSSLFSCDTQVLVCSRVFLSSSESP